MKEKTDKKIILSILAASDEDFTTETYDDKRGEIDISGRHIKIYFNKDGSFDFISNEKYCHQENETIGKLTQLCKAIEEVNNESIMVIYNEDDTPERSLSLLQNSQKIKSLIEEYRKQN